MVVATIQTQRLKIKIIIKIQFSYKGIVRDRK